MNQTRILFVDDHRLFRESVVRLLEREPDLTIVTQCGTLAEAERIARSTSLDLVLLDYDLGMELGTSIVATLRRHQPGVRILMVTGGMTRSAMREAVTAGVSGIVLKHSDPDRLKDAIRRVARGETWWDTGVLPLLNGDPELADPADANRTITDRQRQILQLILDGLTNKEIAARTNSSESAVKAGIQQLFAKTGVRTRSQLVRIAVENHAADWLNAE